MNLFSKRPDSVTVRGMACVYGLCLYMTFFSNTVIAGAFYKCTDASGNVLFTNTKPNEKQHKCTTLSYYSPPSVAAGSDGASRRRAATNPTPADFPRVAGAEQKSRDGERRAILEKELTTEQANLEKARQLLAANPSQNAQTQRDTVALHERNIKALQKEIGNLR
jgi:hypothetical protein